MVGRAAAIPLCGSLRRLRFSADERPLTSNSFSASENRGSRGHKGSTAAIGNSCMRSVILTFPHRPCQSPCATPARSYPLPRASRCEPRPSPPSAAGISRRNGCHGCPVPSSVNSGRPGTRASKFQLPPMAFVMARWMMPRSFSPFGAMSSLSIRSLTALVNRLSLALPLKFSGRKSTFNSAGCLLNRNSGSGQWPRFERT